VDNLDAGDAAARAVIEHAVLGLDWGSPFRYEAIAAHLIALRGWAKLADELPPALPTGGNVGRRTWRLLDELMFALVKERDPSEDGLTEVWVELLGLCAAATADALANLRSAQTAEYGDSRRVPLYRLLLSTWPEQVRQAYEYALKHQDRLVATFDNGPAPDRLRHLVADLGVVGDSGSVALLEHLVADPNLGAAAIAAVREIKLRLQAS
jgi:hypothetical protein